ncbi:MAG TPA: hypothetical protein VGR71_11795 [Nitrospira sp.]|nr:hypothetical protein [Nitrospira sp.]
MSTPQQFQVDDTPSTVTVWLEQFVRLLETQASEELLNQHLSGVSPDGIQLRLLVLSQMVASNTTTKQRKEWSIKLIKEMAQHYSGVNLDDET